MEGRLLAFIQLSLPQMLGLVQGAVTGALLARGLSVDGRGQVALAVTVIALLPFVLDLGSIRAITWCVAGGADVAAMRRAALRIAGLAIAPVAWLLALFAQQIFGLHGPVLRAFQVGLFMTPFQVIALAGANIVWGRGDYRRLSQYRALPIVCYLICLTALALLHALSPASAILVSSAASLSPLVLIPGDRRRDVECRNGPRSNAVTLVTAGVRGWPGSLATIVNTRADQVLIGVVAGPRILAPYAVAVVFASLPLQIATVSSSQLSRRAALNSWAEVLLVYRVVLTGVAAAALVVGIAAGEALPLIFGSRYADAVTPSYILLAATVALASAFLLNATTATAGQPQIGSFGEVAALLVTLVGFGIVGRRLTGTSAAAISLVAYGTSAILQTFVARARLGATLRDYMLPRLADFAAAWKLLRS